MGNCSCSCVDRILVDGASWSIEVDTCESAKSTALGASATGTRERLAHEETRVFGKHKSELDVQKRESLIEPGSLELALVQKVIACQAIIESYMNHFHDFRFFYLLDSKR
ncbi:hypothetical protein Tco_0956790 [Tanacetum coccineum]